MASEFYKKMAAKAKAAHEKHKSDDTSYDTSGELPPMEGVAQLVDCDIRQIKDGNNKGKWMFYAAGVVLSPEYVEHNGVRVKVAGRRTNIMENLFETPESKSRKTFDDHWAYTLNELRKLGVDTDGLEFEDVEAALVELKESQPTFAFNTRQGKPSTQYPNPRTFHNWNGLTEAEEGTVNEAGGEVADDTPAKDEDEPAEEEEVTEEAEETTEEDAEEKADPDEGDVWVYQSKSDKKPTQYTVTKVYASKRLVDLKSTADPKKIVKGAKWDDLSAPE